MNETTILAAIIAAIVTVLTKVLDALVARRRDRQSGSLEHRKLLSDDERAFRQAVLDEVKELREELDKKVNQLEELRPKLAQAINAQLEAERKCSEAERRSTLLESQIADLRAIHARISAVERETQARSRKRSSSSNEDDG